MSQDLRRRTSREGRWRYPCRKWYFNHIHLWAVNTVSISVAVPSAYCRHSTECGVSEIFPSMCIALSLPRPNLSRFRECSGGRLGVDQGKTSPNVVRTSVVTCCIARE